MSRKDSATQNIATPPEFIMAVERYFGIEIGFDLAASEENTKAPIYFSKENDALLLPWPTGVWCWLNPPFARVGEFCAECEVEAARGVRIISIWPLSADANVLPAWRNAAVYPITGRLWPNVRSLMLCRWEKGISGVIAGLRWDRRTLTLERTWP